MNGEDEFGHTVNRSTGALNTCHEVFVWKRNHDIPRSLVLIPRHVQSG